MTDKRTARASHILFGFKKYPNAEADITQLKDLIDSGKMRRVPQSPLD